MPWLQCRCGKTKKKGHNRRNYTCPECIALRQASGPEDGVTVACAGCGRTVRVRPNKLIRCDGYTCSLSTCKLNPDFQIPEPPVGHYNAIEMYAAGGFSGWKVRRHTPETLAALWRAQQLAEWGRLQFDT